MTVEIISSGYDTPEKKWRDMAAEQQMWKGRLLKNAILSQIEACRRAKSAEAIVEGLDSC